MGFLKPAGGLNRAMDTLGEDRAGMRPSFIQQEEINGGQETDTFLKGTCVAASCAERASFTALVRAQAGTACRIQVNGRGCP